jgi:hypothetical protein
VSTRKELNKARKALARGRADEALVILWNLVEPARLEGDSGTLRAIAALAGGVAQQDEGSRREAERLLETLGRAVPARPEPERADVGFEELDEPIRSAPPVGKEPELEEVEELEAPEPGNAEPADAEGGARRRGAGRYVIPLVTLAIILINVIARVFRDD